MKTIICKYKYRTPIIDHFLLMESVICFSHRISLLRGEPAGNNHQNCIFGYLIGTQAPGRPFQLKGSLFVKGHWLDWLSGPMLFIYISIEAHMTCHLETLSGAMNDNEWRNPCYAEDRMWCILCICTGNYRSSSKLSFPALLSKARVFFSLAFTATDHIRFA